MIRCGASIRDVPRRISWWELWAFYEASGPHSAVMQVVNPAVAGWDVTAVLIARAVGHPDPFTDGEAHSGDGVKRTKTTTGNVETEREVSVQTYGTAMDRDDLDAWFFPAA